MSRRGRRGNSTSNAQLAVSDSDADDEIRIVDADSGVEINQDNPDPIVVVKDDQPVIRQAKTPVVDDDAYAVLKRQFDDLSAAREADNARLREYEKRHVDQAHDQVATQRALLEHASQKARSDLVAAKSRFKEAMTSQDFDAASDAQAAIAEAQLDARNYELARDEFDRRIEHGKQAATKRNADPVEEYIGQFTPKTQDWARRNKSDLFSDQKRTNKAVAGHWAAVSEGITPESDDYFAFLDKHMGYGEDTRQPPKKQAQTQRPAMASAPVSRGSNGGGETVSLSAAERDIAGRMGMSLSKYAKYKKEMLENGNNPNWKGPRYSQFDGNQKG